MGSLSLKYIPETIEVNAVVVDISKATKLGTAVRDIFYFSKG